MTLTITTSLDWSSVSTHLIHNTHQITDRKNMRQMIKIVTNISTMITALSLEEINCRKLGKQTHKHKEMLTLINQEINNYEQMLTFGLLLSN